MNSWKFDMAVDQVETSRLTISNRGQLVLPVTVLVRFNDGFDTRLKNSCGGVAIQEKFCLDSARRENN